MKFDIYFIYYVTFLTFRVPTMRKILPPAMSPDEITGTLNASLDSMFVSCHIICQFRSH